MNKIRFLQVGNHIHSEIIDGKDCNGKIMIVCNDCKACAHAFTEREAIADLGKCRCVSGCQNCENLRNSSDTKPAVPIGGTCDTRLHICPRDGNRWWQSNIPLHFWKQVTNEQEWKSLNKPEPCDDCEI